MKALVAGCFSFDDGHATAGDLLARDVVCTWLERAGFEYEIAVLPPLGEGVDWEAADPARYSHVVYVCGPFLRGELESAFLARFAGCTLIGVDLSMLEPLERWNPFDALIERDSSRRVNPDISFASESAVVPVVGICLVEDYEGAMVGEANAAIHKLVATRAIAAIHIDTRLDENSAGLKSAAEVESLIAKTDVVVTTRLHGLVLSLKHGIPAVVIDPEAGGAKVLRQAQCLGWPRAMAINDVTHDALQEALDWCLSGAARDKARECAQRAREMVDRLRDEFIFALTSGPPADPNHRARLNPLVTVIIPCYNQAHYLDESITSVLAQTYPHRQIIVVDDGSDDNTEQVASRYPAVQYVRQLNGGLSSARNTGIRLSRGDYLVFLDADDRLLPEALQTGLNAFHIHPDAVFVSGHYRYIRADGTPLNHYEQPSIGMDPYRAMLERNYIGMHATVMYRRDIFDRVGGFDTSLKSCEDYDMFLRITRNYPVGRYDRIIADYRQHNASMSIHAGRMLTTALATLKAQLHYIGGNPHYMRACRAGIRSVRKRGARQLASEAYASLRARQWSRARRMLIKLCAYPGAWLSAVMMDARLSARIMFANRSTPSRGTAHESKRE